jgi:hypothetical protein
MYDEVVALDGFWLALETDLAERTVHEMICARALRKIPCFLRG